MQKKAKKDFTARNECDTIYKVVIYIFFCKYNRMNKEEVPNGKKVQNNGR